ncbi:MAG: twin arginine-targeting protein translocase TatC [Omnitrophica WOR_2 bacterium RIFCSPHIGHO2_02_FULL_50_17]|nr:MAG: twin arginine-targeting protein translocase TatC [Omnitrophica WOR_2 bacterium RIFCSPHIGHO2_02_FULL_50_17]
MSRNPDDLSFVGHLEELRSRLIKSLLAVLVAACFFYAFIDKILVVLIQPVGKVVFTSPADAFVARVTLTLYGGVLLALPVIIYQVWRFVAVGLKDNERKYIFLLAPFSLLFFLAGGLFAYFIMIPVSLRFLLSFSSDFIVPMITIKNYISFVGMMILAFGAVFELPMVLVFLTKIGIVTPQFLAEKRRHAIVFILIVSALLTPPDAVTQIIMSVPLVVLYEIGIVACRLTRRS